jgi:hypothetical protein
MRLRNFFLLEEARRDEPLSLGGVFGGGSTRIVGASTSESLLKPIRSLRQPLAMTQREALEHCA